jgi:hypothetical protein
MDSKTLTGLMNSKTLTGLMNSKSLTTVEARELWEYSGSQLVIVMTKRVD